MSEVRVTEVWLIRVVNITLGWVITVVENHEQNRSWLDTVITKYLKPSVEGNKTLNETISQVGMANDFTCNKGVVFSISRHSFHDIKFGVLISEGDSRDEVSSEIDTENENGGER